MQLLDGRLIYSASDVNAAIACEHLTGLERDVALGRRTRPELELPIASVLRELGEAHELRYLEQLESGGAEVVHVERGSGFAGVLAAAEATRRAMQAGAQTIYQAAFFDGEALGYADFLRRVERPSPHLGPWSYEVADTKLGRRSQPYFILQLCFYSECVARIQGCEPERAYVVLGDGREESFELADFAAHFRAVRARFVAGLAKPEPTSPYPVPQCDLCAWQEHCRGELAASDHLSGVATMRRDQIGKLAATGVTTLAGLALAGDEARPAALALPTFERLRAQARLQYEQRLAQTNGERFPYRFEPLPMSEDGKPCGARALPPPDAGDVYFDMEGDPYFADEGRWFGESGGLEYLFGAYLPHEDEFKAFWGCDREAALPRHRLAERRAFTAFVDFLLERRERYPRFHVYHYAPYEKTALFRLAARHATREEEVDDLIRSGHFVDLYHTVKRSVMVGQPHYGLKYLEPFYETTAREGVKKADDSIVAFEQWLAARAAGRDEARLLGEIERYNRYDCESTYHLDRWLRGLCGAGVDGEQSSAPAQPVPARPPRPREAERERRARVGELRERLRAGLGDELGEYELAALPEPARARYLLGELLAYHRREAKPEWWEFYARCDLFEAGDHAALVAHDSTVLAGLELVEQGDGEATLRFAPQEHKAEPGAAYDLATREACGRVIEIDEERGLLRVKTAAKPP
ncbi:MAG TPA: TM0106 family RecB-like putative nuclease, partial [Verrucomicrobiae bacterium]|nr:TM0106 family RecB-like putative nuclease [Verrucomicrobiae bacterium]